MALDDIQSSVPVVLMTTDDNMQEGMKASDASVSSFSSKETRSTSPMNTTKKQLVRSFKASKSLSRKVKKRTMSTTSASMRIAKKVVSKNISLVNKHAIASIQSIHNGTSKEIEDYEIVTYDADKPACSDKQPLEIEVPDVDSFSDSESSTQECSLASPLNGTTENSVDDYIDSNTGEISKELWFLDTNTKVIFHFARDNKWTLEILDNVKPPKTKTKIALAPRLPSIRRSSSVVNAKKNARKSIKFVKKVVSSNIPKQNQMKRELKDEPEGTIGTNEELLSDKEEEQEKEQYIPIQSTVSVPDKPLIITEQSPQEEKITTSPKVIAKGSLSRKENNPRADLNTRTIFGIFVFTAGIGITLFIASQQNNNQLFSFLELLKCDLFSAFHM